MTRIEEKFQELPKREGALICFLTAGDPSLSATEELVLQVAESGADLIELGVPFSDPIADGPSIQASSLRALHGGTTLAGVLECVARVRRKTQVPLVLMSYYNPILRYGLARFAADAVAVGVDGIIPSDLPPEEADEWLARARRQGLDTIFLLAPTSTGKRIQRVAEKASGSSTASRAQESPARARRSRRICPAWWSGFARIRRNRSPSASASRHANRSAR